MNRIAFLGLGALGRPMARHLAKDPFRLKVWNRTAEKAHSFVQEVEGKAKAASTPAEAVVDAQVIITCLPVSADVESLLDGIDGIAGSLVPGAVFVDCTSGDPATSRRIADRVAQHGVQFIDAPVSGGTTGAEKGTLTIMVGGDPNVLERVRHVLEAFGKNIVHCGAIGAGDAVKAVNNALLAVHLWSAAEGLAALTKMGVSPRLALDVINASSGRSNSSENLIPERVLTRAFPRTFRAALLQKDAGIAASIARDQKVPAPVLQLTADLFSVVRGELGEEADHVEAVKLVERWAGVEIK
jgi:3-hydroxyisobutyrate dehydrogenase